VLTHIPEFYKDVLDENIFFTGGNIAKVIDLIKLKHPGTVFIMGGADVANQLLDANLIDSMRLFVCPEQLGSGIKAFKDDTSYNNFTLVDEREYASGIIEEIYQRTL
jgi:dihydrofolate reductase